MIYIIDDDKIMSGCIARACKAETQTFTNAIEAMDRIADGVIPDLIFLDILLDGPDGFTFLNELVSYPDTAKVPIVIVSSLDINKYDLSTYGVVGILDKSTMTPSDINQYVAQYNPTTVIPADVSQCTAQYNQTAIAQSDISQHATQYNPAKVSS